jgi:hypothetical protein
MQRPIFGDTDQGKYPVAVNSNLTNSQGKAPSSVLSKTTLTLSNVLTPGATLPIPATGTFFYVIAANAPLNIRPSGGVFNPYDVGTGLSVGLENAFQILEINNPSANNVAFTIFVGFDGYIDNRLILQQNTTPQIVFPTFPTPAAANVVNITDLSGQAFVDINGGKWYALSRVAMIICNVDGGVTLLLQKANSVVGNGPAIAAIQPLQSLNYPAQGNYRLHLGGANINAIVSEIYYSIPRI